MLLPSLLFACEIQFVKKYDVPLAVVLLDNPGQKPLADRLRRLGGIRSSCSRDLKVRDRPGAKPSDLYFLGFVNKTPVKLGLTGVIVLPRLFK